MTPEKKTRDRTTPIGAGAAFDRLTARRASRIERRRKLEDALTDFDRDEGLAEQAIMARVPEDQMRMLRAMLDASATGAISAATDAAQAPQDTVNGDGGATSHAGVQQSVGAGGASQGDASAPLPAGAQPYVPGPAASAAKGGRR